MIAIFKMKTKPIPNFEGRYEISNEGEVISLNYKNTGQRKKLAPKSNVKSGHLTLSLRDNFGILKTRYVHQLVYDSWVGPRGNAIIDHIDLDCTNNSVSNLRLTDKRGNSCNRAPMSGFSSKYRGVSWDKGMKKWVAYLKNKGEMHRFGYFNDPKRAALVRDEKAKILHGEFASLNSDHFPEIKALERDRSQKTGMDCRRTESEYV